MQSKQAVGMIGIGLMGQGIAHNVVKHGYPFALLDHPGNQPIDRLTASGARVCRTAAEVAAQSDVVILCVTGAPQVEAVITGASGVLEGIKSGAIVVDCSTSLPDTSVRMAAALQAKGAAFLDAAMTKLPQHAQAGTLNLLCGGEAPVLARVRPLLECFSERITHVGPVGAGHRVKLLHNYVSIGFMALLAEVGAHARSAGVDPEILVDVLDKGGGGGAALQRMAPFITQDDASNVPFFVSNAAKDLGYYCDMAAGAGMYRAIADSVSKTLHDAVADGHGGDYIPQLTAWLRTR